MKHLFTWALMAVTGMCGVANAQDLNLNLKLPIEKLPLKSTVIQFKGISFEGQGSLEIYFSNGKTSNRRPVIERWCAIKAPDQSGNHFTIQGDYQLTGSTENELDLSMKVLYLEALPSHSPIPNRLSNLEIFCSLGGFTPFSSFDAASLLHQFGGGSIATVLDIHAYSDPTYNKVTEYPVRKPSDFAHSVHRMACNQLVDAIHQAEGVVHEEKDPKKFTFSCTALTPAETEKLLSSCACVRTHCKTAHKICGTREFPFMVNPKIAPYIDMTEYTVFRVQSRRTWR